MKHWWTVGLGFVALSVLLFLWWTAPWSRPPTEGILLASGRIEGDQAAVGAKIDGKIVQLAVREGDLIQAGALIAELASEQIHAQREHAEHVVHTAQEQLAAAEAREVSAQHQLEAAQSAVRLAEQESRARIGEAQAAVGTAQALLHQAEADLEKATKDHERAQELFARKIIAAQQLDAATAAYHTRRAAVQAARQQVTQADKALELAHTSHLTVTLRQKEVDTARGRLAETQAAVGVAKAQRQTAEASLQLAQANLNDTRVVAPFAGTVLRKLVETGEVITAGTPLITLVDLARLYAKVYVAEAELGKVKIGDQARAYVDAFPKRYFEATVAQVAQQAEFTPRDIHMPNERARLVFAVKLALRNPAGMLKPGMPVDARMRWAPQASWGDGLD
jgi:HlyD family secretion protein